MYTYTITSFPSVLADGAAPVPTVGPVQVADGAGPGAVLTDAPVVLRVAHRRHGLCKRRLPAHLPRADCRQPVAHRGHHPVVAAQRHAGNRPQTIQPAGEQVARHHTARQRALSAPRLPRGVGQRLHAGRVRLVPDGGRRDARRRRPARLPRGAGGLQAGPDARPGAPGVGLGGAGGPRHGQVRRRQGRGTGGPTSE